MDRRIVAVLIETIGKLSKSPRQLLCSEALFNMNNSTDIARIQYAVWF